MKITDVQTACIEANFRWNLIRITTDAGITGIGEAYWGPGVLDVVKELRMMLIGEDPMDVQRLWTWMMYGQLDTGQRPVRPMGGSDVTERYGMSAAGSTAGATVAAVSGIEIALLDIIGKKLRTPVYQLLGGKYRDRVRVYADAHSGQSRDAQSWTERLNDIRDRGYTAVKFDLDDLVPDLTLDAHNRSLSAAAIRRMVGMTKAVLAAAGDDVEVALDCHWSYNITDAIRLARALDGLPILWLEDPIPPELTMELSRVTSISTVPICSGENLYTRHGFRSLIESAGCHIIQPDMPRCGGLMEAKRIAENAEVHGIPFAAHNVCSPVGTLAAAHACAAIRTFIALEFHSSDIPWWDSVVSQRANPVITDGWIRLADVPGLGIELNDDVCKQHLADGTEYFAAI